MDAQEDRTRGETGGAAKQRPWLQLLCIVGEAILSLITNGLLYILISRVSGSELLGAYALSTSWFALFQGWSSFGVPEYLLREMGAHGRRAAPQVVYGLMLGLASGGVAVVLMATVVQLIGYPPAIARAIQIASLALVPAFLTTASRSVFLARREMHLTLLALAVEVAILTTLSVGVLLSGHGPVALMISFVVAKIASAVVAVTLMFRILRPFAALDFKLLAQTARVVLSFGMGNVLGMLTMRVNLIMASAFVDIAAVGHFAAATKVMEVALIVTNLFVQLLMTRVAHSYTTLSARDPNRFAHWYQILFVLMVPACVGGFVFAKLILNTLFGSGFGDAAWLLRLLMVYLFIESGDALMSVLLKAAHLQREDVPRVALNPIINILLNLALLPLFGTLGSAIARVGGALASSTARHILISERLGRLDWLRFVWKPAVINLGVGAICVLFFDVDRSLMAVAFYVIATLLLTRIFSVMSLQAIKDIISAPTS